MAERLSFLHRPYELNPAIIVCHCLECGKMVGASSSYRLLNMVEEVHQCSEKDSQANKFAAA